MTVVRYITIVAFAAFGLGGFGPSAEAASCGSFMSSCAARCKKDNPADRDCVSDHCSPKFASCKATGCWTEGARYGGGTTCSLK